jgi:hypothetical protein
MRKRAFVLCIYLFISHSCFAYDQLKGTEYGTHYKITEQAVKQSIIVDYLDKYLGISLNDEFKGPDASGSEKTWPVLKWINFGGDWEDVPEDRCFNHFYDPLTGYGLTGQFQFYSSALEWAKEPTLTNEWSWVQARVWYYTALKHHDVNISGRDSNYNFAKTFRSLGQIMHLLQDMAVPAHTRNDIHPPKYGLKKWQQDLYEKYAVDNILSLSYGGYVMQPIPFNKFDDYWHTDSGGKGLADFTNRNFLSRNTNLDDNEYASPVAINRDVIEEQYVTDHATNEQSLVYVKYASGNVFDDYTGERKPITHLAAYSFFDYEMENENGHKVYSLDEECHKEYASFLIPRAVGYSAGLLNYFFRGTLEVTEAVAIDGDESGIKKISAKAVNTSPNDSTPNGEVFAFARYKIGTEPEYSYSVSTSATDESGTPVTSIERSTDAAMIFDFSNKPIPANVKELYLHVVYYGDLGNELATGIAIGMDEVSDVYVLLKSGDYYTVFSSRTSAVVEKLNNPLYGRKDPDGNLLYPDAPEFFQFPVKGQDANDPFYVFKNKCLKTEISIQLFKEITDSNLQRYGNDQKELPGVNYEITRDLAEQQYAGADCANEMLPWRIGLNNGYDTGWENVLSDFYALELYTGGAWNKINKREDVVFSSSYESSTINDNTTTEYSGSWDPGEYDIGCIYENGQCSNYCDCLRANAENQFVTREASGEHDDTVHRIKMINVKKYTPLGTLFNEHIKDIDVETNYQGDAAFECTYTLRPGCAELSDGRCGAVIDPEIKTAVNNWDNPASVTNAEDVEEIIPHTESAYNGILGKIHADSQQVMQIHYHALDIQYKNASTHIAPKIYVLAQLNRHENAFDKATDHINFKTKDGKINEPFGSAIQSLIEYSMNTTGTGIVPQGISSSFVIVK